MHFIKEGGGVAVKSKDEEEGGIFAEFLMVGGTGGTAVGYYDKDTEGREEGLWVVVRMGEGQQEHPCVEWYDWKGGEVEDDRVEGLVVKVNVVENVEGSASDWKTKKRVIRFVGRELKQGVSKGDVVVVLGGSGAFAKYAGMEGDVMCNPGINENGEERTLVEVRGMDDKIINIRVDMLALVDRKGEGRGIEEGV